MMTLQDFFRDHLKEILPIYEAHEMTFDPYGIHGRAHIIRSLLIAEIVMNYLEKHTLFRYKRDRCYFAIAFHDAGREANGPDLWERESAALCCQYMLKQGYSSKDAAHVSSYIYEKEPIDETHKVILDADIIEILRLINIEDFDHEKLYLSRIDITKDQISPPVMRFISMLCEFVIKSSGEIVYLYLEGRTGTNSLISEIIHSLHSFPKLFKLLNLKYALKGK